MAEQRATQFVNERSEYIAGKPMSGKTLTCLGLQKGPPTTFQGKIPERVFVGPRSFGKGTWYSVNDTISAQG